ncbi:MAG: hypothetical protein HY908_01820 [Myxococcales bacterium]|nr:hypothetical protein [Myxococcales bacterium]
MSSDDPSSPPAATEQQWRDVPIDWEALEDAFENNAPEVHSYLHVPTGDVLRIVDGIADPQMHARIAADTSYLRIEPVSSREQYRWMERYIPMVEDEELRTKLTRAIDGKGAFRRFKDVLMGYGPERERWFSFRSERLRIFMEAWLNAHALNPVKRPVWVPDLVRDEPGAGEAPMGADDAADAAELREPRRARNAESLRRALRELVELLPPRDLEALCAFGEFLRARGAAHPAAPPAPPPAEPTDAPEPKAEEDPTTATPAATAAAPVRRTRARAGEKATAEAAHEGEPSSAKVPAGGRARGAASG